MDRMRNGVVLTKLIEELRAQGSWCGETHVQKTMFFVQELMHVPTQFEFILYKHGPFSFDLRDELTALRADGLIGIDAQSYGAKLVPTQRSDYVKRYYGKTAARYASAVEFVAERLGRMKVAELERLGTAFYVYQRSEDRGASASDRARRVVELKPHISAVQARQAVEEVDRLIADATARQDRGEC